MTQFKKKINKPVNKQKNLNDAKVMKLFRFRCSTRYSISNHAGEHDH